MTSLINFINQLNTFGKSMVFLLILLLILLVVLLIVYIIKKHDELKKDEINFDFFDDLKTETTNDKSIYTEAISVVEEKKEEEKPLATKIETVKIETPKVNKVENTKPDLKAITEQMEKDIEKNNIELTEFELEQEEKAIISYEELINKVKNNESLNLEIEAHDLDDRGYVLENEFTFDTEILDFSDLIDEQKNKEQIVMPIKPSEEMIKQTTVKSILDIDENLDNNIYNAVEFLNALKELRDSLQ